MNVLFNCSRNRLRSPTAEFLFADCEGINTASAGTSSDAEVVVSADLMEWADLIFAMQAVHKRKLSARFAQLLRSRRIVVLNIRDEYDYMEPALIVALQARVLPILQSSAAQKNPEKKR